MKPAYPDARVRDRREIERMLPNRGEVRWGRRATLFVGALVAVLGVTMGALAAIPDSDGIVHACYNPKRDGALRVIDPDAGDQCRAAESALFWNQEGVPGETGPQGEPGPAGRDGAALQERFRNRYVVTAGSPDTTVPGFEWVQEAGAANMLFGEVAFEPLAGAFCTLDRIPLPPTSTVAVRVFLDGSFVSVTSFPFIDPVREGRIAFGDEGYLFGPATGETHTVEFRFEWPCRDPGQDVAFDVAIDVVRVA